MNRECFRSARANMLCSTMKIRVGAVVATPAGVVVAGGFNEIREVPTEAPYSIHAEIAALLDHGRLRSDTGPIEMYVYRETKPGVIATSRPCVWCLNELPHHGVTMVHYTHADGPHYRTLHLR